jgi:hypothetical protein
MTLLRSSVGVCPIVPTLATDGGTSMSSDDVRPAIYFAGPATYRIVVQGVVSRYWRERLGGLVVATVDRADGSLRTTLAGRVQDQAELKGVLETLCQLRLPILKVEATDDSEHVAS